MSRKLRKQQILYLLDSTDAAVLLRQRLLSRQWWIFVLVQRAGLPFMVELERRHYAGKKNRDFEMMALPFVAGLGIVGIGQTHKKRLSARQLSRLFDEAEMSRQAEDVARGERDVVLLAPSQETGQRAAQWLLSFVAKP